ncbi:phage tail protein [Avibacterium paragallinarum]|uniref:phage tail protein n=1 Tax=Avibacterium paragallinarum TaxID=728 RepID=UPI001C9918AD|nr:phage tail protein [Avibacterium paragallinarum]QZP15715.1 phage tail protein [Avibacterium paragallinarum]
MYCLLGDIVFEPIDLTEFSETQQASFAEHAVMRGKPRLQATGDGLTTLQFAARLHHQIGGVESRWRALSAAKSAQQALALVWGRNGLKGNYVITNLSSTTLFTDDKGNVLCREINVSLTEYIGKLEATLQGAALQLGNNRILGSILPKNLTNALSEIKSLVNKGVQLYQAGKRAVDDVKNIVAVMRQLKTDPLSALNHLPQALSGLDQSLGAFSDLVGMRSVLDSVSPYLNAVGEFVQSGQAIYDTLSFAKTSFEQLDIADWDKGFAIADNALNEVIEHIDNLATTTAEMTAWVVLRNDEEENNENRD